MAIKVSVLASLYGDNRIRGGVVDVDFNPTDAMMGMQRRLMCQLLLEQATEFGKSLCKQGICVIVRPNYNERMPTEAGILEYFREWRSFDGGEFEEVRFECDIMRGTKPARVDADKTAKPLTRLVAQVNPRHCVPHGGIGAVATHIEDEHGEREPLAAHPTNCVSHGGFSETSFGCHECFKGAPARHHDTGIILPEGLEDRAMPPEEREHGWSYGSDRCSGCGFRNCQCQKR